MYRQGILVSSSGIFRVQSWPVWALQSEAGFCKKVGFTYVAGCCILNT